MRVSLVVAVALTWLVVAGSLALLLGAVAHLRSSRVEESSAFVVAPTPAPRAPVAVVPAPRTPASAPAEAAAAPR